MILIKIAVMSLVCFGVHAAINTFLFKIWHIDLDDLELMLPRWATFWLSPVMLCTTCMASFWGTTTYLLLHFSGMTGNVFEWVICVLATCGLTTLVAELVFPDIIDLND